MNEACIYCGSSESVLCAGENFCKDAKACNAKACNLARRRKQHNESQKILARHAYEDCVRTHGMDPNEAARHVENMMKHYPPFKG